MKRLPVMMIPVDAIDIPAQVNRPRPNRLEDEVLLRSIRQGGIQQPLVVLAVDDGYQLVDGSRRLDAARALGLPRVPAVVDMISGERDPESYGRRIRFILDEHRQDLLPSQKAELIVKLKEAMGLNNGQMAAYLGVDPDSITNWLAIRRYIPEVARAIDVGALTMQQAKAMEGMGEEGQRVVWKKHAEDLMQARGGAHRRIREQYPPEKYPQYYLHPERRAAILARGKRPRRGGKTRPNDTAGEKKRLLANVEAKEAELAELKEEMAQSKREIAAASPVIAAMLRNSKLRALIPEEMLPELERFAETYC
jgi:ParB/RepB/Spo0J family partition protein